MCHASVLALTTIVALSVQIQVCVGIGTDGRNDIIRLIFTHIQKLQRQAESVQFAALFLLTEQEVQDHNKFQFIPHDKNKRPLVNNRSYYCPDNQYCQVPANQRPQNYVVARPNKDGGTHTYAEEFLLEQLPSMWERWSTLHYHDWNFSKTFQNIKKNI